MMLKEQVQCLRYREGVYNRRLAQQKMTPLSWYLMTMTYCVRVGMLPTEEVPLMLVDTMKAKHTVAVM